MAPKIYDEAAMRYINASGEERIKMFLDPGPGGAATRPGNPEAIQLPFLPHITLLSSSPDPLPRATFLYTVQHAHCNGWDTLSGGGAATLIDFLSTLPICHVADPAWLHFGVSRNLTLTFLRPMVAGETVRIECEILGIGRAQATVRAVIKSEADGGLMVTAEHGLVRNPGPKV